MRAAAELTETGTTPPPPPPPPPPTTTRTTTTIWYEKHRIFPRSCHQSLTARLPRVPLLSPKIRYAVACLGTDLVMWMIPGEGAVRDLNAVVRIERADLACQCFVPSFRLMSNGTVPFHRRLVGPLQHSPHVGENPADHGPHRGPVQCILGPSGRNARPSGEHGPQCVGHRASHGRRHRSGQRPQRRRRSMPHGTSVSGGRPGAAVEWPSRCLHGVR